MARVAVLLAATLAVLVVAAPAAPAKLKQPTAKSALNKLVRQTSHLPRNGKTAKLKAAARKARRNVRKHPCKSVHQLARYRTVLRGVKVPKNRRARNRLRALVPTSMNASRALLASKKTKRCGGGVKPSTRETANTTILKSDANGMQLKVDLPALRFVDAEGGGRTWTKLVLPNTDAPGAPGSPGIPVVSDTFGVPDGATLKVDATKTTSYTIGGVDVFPAQPDPVDQVSPAPNFLAGPFATQPFERDAAEYRSRASFPAEAADGVLLGRSRDLLIGNLRIPAAQYKPSSHALKVLNSVNVTVSFEGGLHKFPAALQSPWEGPQRSLRDSLLNRAAFDRDPLRLFQRCGE